MSMEQDSSRHLGRVALIGFGGVRPISAQALAAAGHEVSVFDIKLLDAATRRTVVQRVRDCEDCCYRQPPRQLIICAVRDTGSTKRRHTLGMAGPLLRRSRDRLEVWR
jgi:hypothetical protein